ncbi:MAG: sulfatase-like hydrolase/transferase, partial [Bacteroidota bacterium]
MKRTLHSPFKLFYFLMCLLLTTVLQAQNKPNVIVILADDMGFSDIEPYGGEIITPNLTELAENGIRFRRFYNTTKCSPTRASLLTGQYSHEAGMEDLSNAGGNQSPAFLGYLPDNVVTMAEAFKTNGYGTYLSGKWHVGEDQGHWPRDRGFDRCWGLISGASSYYEIISKEDNPNQRADRKMVLDDQLWDPDDTDDPNNPYAPGEFFMTDATSDYAIEFLNEHFQTQNNNPFFLYLSFTAPHWPLHAHESDIDKYDGAYSQGYEAIRDNRFAEMKNLQILGETADLSPKDHNSKWENLSNSKKAEEERKMQVYSAMVDRMDQNIGRVMTLLKNNGKFNNTIIIFLSDNGGSREDVSGRKLNDPNKEIGEKGSYVAYERPWSNVSNTPFRQHKNDTYEGGIVTPMIIHHPASISVPTGGAFTDQIAHVKDLMPTLLEMTNSNYPSTYQGNVIKEMSGRSFKHNMDDVDDVEQWEIFFEYSGNRAVRHGNWKAVSESANGQWFLFNMEDDPVELSSVAGSYPDIVDQLDKRYDLWEISVNHAAGTLPNPNNAPVLLNPVEDQIIREDRLFTFTFEANTFTDDPDDDLVYEATLTNGDDLPEWLKFDDLLRQFSGIPPVGSLNTPIEVRLVAVDWAENKTIDEFQFILDPQNTGGNNDPLTCLLVLNDPNSLNGSDEEIKDRIEMLGYELTMVSDEDAATNDADDMTIVVISSTVSPGKIGTKFKEVEAGVITWEVSLFPEMDFTGPTIYQDYGGQGSQTSMIIENEDHPLAGGLDAGTQVVMNKPKTFYFGIPSSEAITIATQLNNPA